MSSSRGCQRLFIGLEPMSEESGSWKGKKLPGIKRKPAFSVSGRGRCGSSICGGMTLYGIAAHWIILFVCGVPRGERGAHGAEFGMPTREPRRRRIFRDATEKARKSKCFRGRSVCSRKNVGDSSAKCLASETSAIGSKRFCGSPTPVSPAALHTFRHCPNERKVHRAAWTAGCADGCG